MADKSINNRVRIGIIQLQGEGLFRTLEKHHITGIAISGTVGAGLFITSGEILSLAGSLGAVIAYAVAGGLVLCVMLCLSEMISIRPTPGAFFEFPSLFVHESLGFAASWAYWIAYTCSCCTLTVEAGMLLDYWRPPISIPLAILFAWLPVVLFNFFGPVVWYGRLEWSVKWLKIILIIAVSALMIIIAAGVRGSGPSSIASPSVNWSSQQLFSAGFCFSGAYDCHSDGDIPGSLGTFLGVWTSITTVLFAFIGVEIVVIAAGEAKYPRHDLPNAARWIIWFAITAYVTLMVLASLNVSPTDPALLQYALDGPSNIPQSTLEIFPAANDSSVTTGDRSPFIIALKRAGFTSTLPGIVNGALFFAATTAANTAFYVSSRTFYQLCIGGRVHSLIRDTFGSTTNYGIPLWSICLTITFSAFAFIGAIKQVHNEIVGVVSSISVTSILCVYISQCIAFIRYQKAYKRRFGTNRVYKDVPGQENCYRSGLHQPLPAIIAIVFGSLLLFFNGWVTFYQASRSNEAGFQFNSGKIAAGLLGSYLGPTLFICLFLGHKFVHGKRLVPYQVIQNTLDSISDLTEDLASEPLRYRQLWKRVLAEMR